MALITPPTATDVYNRLREKGIGPEHFIGTGGVTMATDSDVITLIDNEILPDVVSVINAQADIAAKGLDFPFTSDVLVGAYPLKSSDQITELINSQQAPFHKAILFEAMAETVDRIASSNAYFTSLVDQWKTWSDQWLERGTTWIKLILSLTPEGQAEGQAGFGSVTIDLEPVPVVDEFGVIYSAT